MEKTTKTGRLLAVDVQIRRSERDLRKKFGLVARFGHTRRDARSDYLRFSHGADRDVVLTADLPEGERC